MQQKNAIEFSSSPFELSDKQLVQQFFRSRKSKATCGGYFKSLSYVLGFDRGVSDSELWEREPAISKIADFVTFSKQNRPVVEYRMKDWILTKRSQIEGATIRGYVSAVKSLLEFCGCALNWKQIQSVLPPARRTTSKDCTPISGTRQLFNFASDLRLKFLISLFVSSGIRDGALDYLTVGDLEELTVPCEGKDITIAVLTVYRGEAEEYKTFASSECLSLWKAYRSERERRGEVLTSSSPLLRNMTSIFGATVPRRLSSNSVRDLFSVAWRKAGLGSQNRTWKEIHGFRAYFRTSLESSPSGMKSVRIERLLGHVQGLDFSYDKPSIQVLAQDYCRLQHLLTIDESLISKIELEKVRETSIEEIKGVKVDLILQNQTTEQLQRQVDTLTKRLEERDQNLEKAMHSSLGEASLDGSNPPFMKLILERLTELEKKVARS